jgi:choline dehydrogenase-like flavoprotein
MADEGNETDVLIIGAGASGAAVAWSLARQGIAVTCLEQGGWVDPTSYPHDKPDWELHRQTDFSNDPNVRRLPEDYPLNNEETPIRPVMYNAVGGSTIHWTGHFPRFRPSDFRVRTLDGVADDWPISYADLEPFYEQNDTNIGVAGLNGDPGNPYRSPRPLPPVGVDRGGQAFIRGLERLGWHWWLADGAMLTAPYGKDRQICNRCGPCDLGCPTGAMSSAHVTYWPKAVDLGARLITHARVREITIDSRGQATGAVYYDRKGVVRHQAARAVVLACNGIGTPRLLLASVSGRFPDGLANSSDQVGRNLMFHPFGFVSGVFEDELASYQGPLGVMLHCQEFYESDPSRGFVRGCHLQLHHDFGPLGTALGGLTLSRVPWGTKHHQVMRERLGHTISISAVAEDLPEPHNRVTLDDSLTDDHGIPAPKISYKLSRNSHLALDFAVARGVELLEACGASEVLTRPRATDAGWHLMGTARMGDDPATSVVDRWGRTHDVPNLFVVDGSLFVTCAPINPTSTIQALALRTADWIGTHHRELTHDR